MESQNFGHSHPLVPCEEQSDKMKEANCSRCGDVISGPSLCCVDQCGFYLHKGCAEAPSKIHHPFHRDHPLVLMPKPPYSYCPCDFCGKKCELSVYHCSCQIDLHIKCALFSLNVAERKLRELEHITIKDPSLSSEDGNKELESANCFGCLEPLLESSYFSLDCGFNLHKKCVELPHEINHPLHNKHPLTLQFNRLNGARCTCKICQKSPSWRGFIYGCSPCKFALHMKCAVPCQINHPCHHKHPLSLQLTNSEKFSCTLCQETEPEKPIYCCLPCKVALHVGCMSPPSQIKEENHQHPFTLFWKSDTSICSACGLGGNFASYVCLTCHFQVHKKCVTSLPSIVKVPRHEHPIFHNYFLTEAEHKAENWLCNFCYTEVNTEYGSYYCSNCKFIAHVNCVMKDDDGYRVLEAEDEDQKLDVESALSIICVEKNEDGEMTKIKHFSHEHDLCLSGKVVEKYCDGCILPISDSFYNCSQCDFFLHQTCAEAPKKKHLWFQTCQPPLTLVVGGYIFRCYVCDEDSTGFFYECTECGDYYCCLRCAKEGYIIKHQGHEHQLFYYHKIRGRCSGCGRQLNGLHGFRCNRCNFILCNFYCTKAPLKAWHECDEHPLALTYHEKNDYSQYHYCDICEKERDPTLWYYHCSTCDISAHPKCALGKHPFIKPGSIHKRKDHPHPLTVVRKAYHYPRCRKCGELCEDLALECSESACNYIVHWECVIPYVFLRKRIPLDETQADDVKAHDS